MDNKALCMKLAASDSEEVIIRTLKEVSYWNNEDDWEYFGGRENNFSTIGNQQSRSDQALVEKLINAIDAMLIAECIKQGIDPESTTAPKSITDAMKTLFSIENGKLANMNTLERKKLAENISLVATGNKTSPTFTIIDKGEGQKPDNMINTLLSIGKSNKLRIPFVQGKFNMGGTGVFQFCGSNNLQLIISKRNPALLNGEDVNNWGFTIVRRENPRDSIRSSCYKYLAPNGEILNFSSDSLNLLPGKYPIPLEKPLQWGTFIKLFDYQIGSGLRSNIMLDLNLRLSLLMPSLALPIRLFERRAGYIGHSFDTTLAGLTVRLEEDKRENIEDGYPTSANLNIDGYNLKASIFAFKRNKTDKKEMRETYAKNEGVIFTINGQTHGYLSKSFFNRKSVQLGYIANSILVIIDCSGVDGRAREDLFMNSRDRLREGILKSRIEKEISELLKNHKGLRELKERRRREDIEGKLEDSKPLAEVIELILAKSPTLANLFVKGIRLQNPFKLKGTNEQTVFNGKKFPTIFKLKKQFTKMKPKPCPINRKFRLKYTTDAANDYLVRDNDPGTFTLKLNGSDIQNFSLNLWNGTATLQVELPENVKLGNVLSFQSHIEDVQKALPIVEDFYVEVEEKLNSSGGGNGNRAKPPSNGNGKNTSNDELSLPNVIEIRSPDWAQQGFKKDSALKVIDSGESGFDFYINLDNIHLLTEIKTNRTINHKLLEARYKYGMVLIGLSLLKDDDEKPEDQQNEIDKFDQITEITKSISPILLPMISGLGELQEEEVIENLVDA